MLYRISGARTLRYLGESNIIFSPKIILDSIGGIIIYLPVGVKLEVIGVFRAPIFYKNPRKILEILWELNLLVRKTYPVLPQGKLKFEVVQKKELESTVTICFFSKKKKRAPFSLFFDNYNAYQAAQLFIQIMSSPQ